MIELSDYQKTELNRACELAAAPSTHLRPRLYPDGNMWCALYGDNLQEGLAGFGKTPEGAMADFDYNFRCQILPSLHNAPVLPVADAAAGSNSTDLTK